jgi:competence protein ComEC
MLEITFWDVKHGNAAYIKTPNNRHIVVDLGDDGANFSPLRTLYSSGVRQLDLAIITHPHRDHIDDIGNLSLLNPKSLWMPWHLSEQAILKGNRAEDMDVVRQYLAIKQNITFPVDPGNDSSVPANFGGASFRVFSPRYCDDGNINNHSLVMIASYAGLKVVLPGDNEASSWKELLKDAGFVSAVKGADILLAPHHGRDAGYCAELFEAMGKPRLVVISDARFGDTSATDRYGKQTVGWEVFDSSGTKETRKCITTRCDGHIMVKMGWYNADPQQGNFLNVTTSRQNYNALAARALGWNG